MDEPLTMRHLLEVGAHFGHRTRHWNPKMAPYIFTERHGVHLIDLQQTLTYIAQAQVFVTGLTAAGGTLLFVGTKRQAQDAMQDEATRCSQPYINQRWMGGMLTNFSTIQLRIRYLRELEARRVRGDFERLPKREVQILEAKMTRLERILGGIKGMRSLPSALFVIDTNKERTAITEAHRLDIPVIALVDTNSDPDAIDYPIPANDDGIRANRLLTGLVADAAIGGYREREMQEKAELEEREKAEPTQEERELELAQ